MMTPEAHPSGLTLDEAERRLERINEVIAARKTMRRPKEHLRVFADNPVGFIEDALGDVLWSGQKEIAEAVRDHDLVAVRSSHGPGKSFIAAGLVAWFETTAPNRFAVTSAPTDPQVKAILWKELNDAHRRGKLAGRMNLKEWYVDDRLVAMGRKPSDYDEQAFQGIHAPGGVLVVLDEAAGIAPTLWKAARAITTTRNSKILAIGNPDDPTSPFQRCFADGSRWHGIKIDAFSTPHFTGEADEIRKRYEGTDKQDRAELLLDGLVQPQWVSDIAEEFGEDSPFYISRVLAEFPDTAVDQLIPLSWIKRAQARWDDADEGGAREIACDVARKGDNETAIYMRTGYKVWRLRCDRALDTIEAAAWCKHFRHHYGAQAIKVDGVGVGGGTVDELTHDAEPVADLNSGSKAQEPKRFYNARAEWWWHLRDLFKTDQIAIPPDDEQLQEQLRQIRYAIQPKTSQIIIESKQDMESRGVASPDRADAVCMLFVPEAVPDATSKEEEVLVEATMYED